MRPRDRKITGALAVVIFSTLLAIDCTRQIHPGSVSTLDSQAYDLLLSSDTAIEQAKLDYDAGKFDAVPISKEKVKAVINDAVAAHNTLRASWLLYRHSVQPGGVSSQELFDQVNHDVNTLNAAIVSLVQAVGGK